MEPISRRRVLQGAAITAASAALPVGAAGPHPMKKRSLRIAHLTDIHVQQEKGAGQGMATVLKHVEAQKDRPDVIFTGGDLIMDCFGADFARTKAQWDLFDSVLRDHTGLKVEHCIGNHDVWSFSKREDNPQHAAKAVKKWACDVLRLDRPYRSFDRAGWHFIVLDSTHASGNSYVAKLDEEQFDWLAADLARTPSKTPVLVMSHIPILAACAYFDGENEKTGHWAVPGAWMHIDARRIKNLFAKHPNVQAAISGHIHLLDRVDYNGVTYLCNGAVCGAWWGGSYQECPPGYAMLDLYDDGSVEREYVEWGWKPTD
ncbi:MAG: 3',5'-cyclic adenosine monophosphate phosphodiesterase CpdA [Fimbriimonadaceae bacterium]|nr:3',5'-cyclic adenosine monophosphate phosphodiesterase CpdA [Fimbriimonadaceae bacterium]